MDLKRWSGRRNSRERGRGTFFVWRWWLSEWPTESRCYEWRNMSRVKRADHLNADLTLVIEASVFCWAQWRLLFWFLNWTRFLWGSWLFQLRSWYTCLGCESCILKTSVYIFVDRASRHQPFRKQLQQFICRGHIITADKQDLWPQLSPGENAWYAW